MSQSNYVFIKYANNLIKITKAPYETEENAYDRAWYIAKNLLDNTSMSVDTQTQPQTHKIDEFTSWIEKDGLSHIWANEKYLSMKYK